MTTKPFEVNVSSRYGAPMGRASDELSEFVGPVHLERVPMVDGDYDAGGAYWGGSRPYLFCAWDNEGHATYIRAEDAPSAKRKLPGLTFTDEQRGAVVYGIASMMWADAWASHAEEHDCYNLSGCRIEDCMPDVPMLAIKEAEAILLGVEKANGCAIEELLAKASKANDDEADAESFGNSLAFMYMGAGVGWFDDHAKFPLKVPYGENCELRWYADTKCTEESASGRVACKHCSSYGVPGDKCGNCGKRVTKPRKAKKTSVTA